MKGGITSGVVYPSAVCRLAEIYRFVNIGGTSAGAIAAAATAAAEYRRAQGSGEGFEKLSRLPAFLAAKPNGSKHTNLFRLFQPDPAVRILFDLGVSFTRKGVRQWISVFGALVKGAWLVWFLFAILTALYILLPLFSTLRASLFDRLSSALWLIGGLTAGLATVLFSKLSLLPRKGFGLCSGMTQNRSGHPALTAWFHEYINDLAGKPLHEPLTFGDLNTHGIQLRMISTCLTHRRPYGLPFDSAQFYFKRSDLEEYFPKPVIQWMEKHQRPPEKGTTEVDETGFCRLPQASEMPVLVAARMSLSFPVLFRAVPLYAVDFSLAQPETSGAPQQDKWRTPERCWFLDGGICSNFPIYMFDAPLPRWPTFGIDLQGIREDRPEGVVWMPSRNSEGFGEQFHRIPDPNSIGAIFKYAAAMIDAARNWTENRQMTVPGYRDRIVHIRLDEGKEGGLNLDMDPAVVTEVSDRGLKAAELLLSHFLHPTKGVTLTWDNHRWIRFRSALARLEEVLQQFQLGLSEPEPGELSYVQLLDRGPDEPPPSYRVTQHQREFIQQWMKPLLASAHNVSTAPESSRPSYKQPRPTPILRVSPRIVPEASADRPDAAPIDPQKGEEA